MRTRAGSSFELLDYTQINEMRHTLVRLTYCVQPLNYNSQISDFNTKTTRQYAPKVGIYVNSFNHLRIWFGWTQTNSFAFVVLFHHFWVSRKKNALIQQKSLTMGNMRRFSRPVREMVNWRSQNGWKSNSIFQECASIMRPLISSVLQLHTVHNSNSCSLQHR